MEIDLHKNVLTAQLAAFISESNGPTRLLCVCKKNFQYFIIKIIVFIEYVIYIKIKPWQRKSLRQDVPNLA